MICRHSPGDPNCGSGSYGRSYASAPATPDASNYTVEDIARCGSHLVLKVKYPNCSNCAFEGIKVMVFLNVTELEALRWRKIDPHFRGSKAVKGEAPSPAARFPGTTDGWSDALAYAQGKVK